MHVFLETDRLLLRRFTEADVDNLVELDSDPEVMRYLNGGAPTPREVVESVILPRFMAWYERSDCYGYWAAIEQSTGTFIGWLSLHPVGDRPADIPEIGYRLRRSVWGKGYATEGVVALIRKGFAECGARRIQGTTYEDNTASRRVMEKAGMKLAGSYRPTLEALNATFTWTSDSTEVWEGDDVTYVVDRADWEPSC